MYDKLRLIRRPPGNSEYYRSDSVDFFINGHNLIEIIREIEQPFADREGHPHIAGKYQGLPTVAIFLPSRHLLGYPTRLYSNRVGQVQLLQCTCGEAGCWPLRATITIETDRMIWDQFHQPYRGSASRASHWRYDALPPFVFERVAYEAALTPTPYAP